MDDARTGWRRPLTSPPDLLERPTPGRSPIQIQYSPGRGPARPEPAVAGLNVVATCCHYQFDVAQLDTWLAWALTAVTIAMVFED